MEVSRHQVVSLLAFYFSLFLCHLRLDLAQAPMSHFCLSDDHSQERVRHPYLLLLNWHSCIFPFCNLSYILLLWGLEIASLMNVLISNSQTCFVAQPRTKAILFLLMEFYSQIYCCVRKDSWRAVFSTKVTRTLRFVKETVYTDRKWTL